MRSKWERRLNIGFLILSTGMSWIYRRRRFTSWWNIWILRGWGIGRNLSLLFSSRICLFAIWILRSPWNWLSIVLREEPPSKNIPTIKLSTSSPINLSSIGKKMRRCWLPLSKNTGTISVLSWDIRFNSTFSRLRTTQGSINLWEPPRG